MHQHQSFQCWEGSICLVASAITIWAPECLSANIMSVSHWPHLSQFASSSSKLTLCRVVFAAEFLFKLPDESPWHFSIFHECLKVCCRSFNGRISSGRFFDVTQTHCKIVWKVIDLARHVKCIWLLQGYHSLPWVEFGTWQWRICWWHCWMAKWSHPTTRWHRFLSW